MKIDLLEAFIPVRLAAPYVGEAAGQWAQHIVKVIDGVSLYLQNPSLAYLALIGVNIAFFEIAVQICRVVNFLFNLIENYEEAQHPERCLRSLVLGAVFVSIIGVGNWAFYSRLRLPISKATTVAVNVLSCMAYFIYKSGR